MDKRDNYLFNFNSTYIMREKDRILLEVKLLTDVAEAIGNTYLTNKLKNLGNLICAEFNKDLEFQLETLKKQNEHLL